MTTDAPSAPADSPRSDLRFLIIGAGMSGILSAIKLQEAGLDNFAIYEKADRLGGTWRENTYPGLACDVPFTSVQLLVRPQPGLEPDASRRDPRSRPTSRTSHAATGWTR